MTARRAPAPAVLAVLVGLVAAGCGSAPGSEPGSGAPGGSRSAPDAPADPTAPAEPSLPAAAPDDTWSLWAKGRPTTDLSGQEPAGFTAAGGVVSCVFASAPDGSPESDARVRCDRSEGLGVDQPRPPDCDDAWGDAVVASVRDGGSLVCGGRPVVDVAGATDGSRRLADGEAVTYEGLTCASRDASVQCLVAGADGPDGPDGSGSRGFVVSARVVVVR